MMKWLNKLLPKSRRATAVAKISPPVLGVSELPGNSILLDAVCLVLLPAEIRVVTVSVEKLVMGGVKAIFGPRSKGVDPVLGFSPTDAAHQIVAALEGLSPGVWQRVLDEVASRAKADVLIVHDLNRDSIEWLKTRGAPIIGDGLTALPVSVTISDPHNLPAIADALEKL